jgi:hypothetical protein
MQPRRQSLPVLLLIKTAFQLLWQQRDDALRLGLVPTLLLFGGFLYGEQALQVFFTLVQGGALDQLPPEVVTRVIVLSAIVFVAICLLTVNWLRFLLLGPMGAIGIGLTLGRPHFGFLVALVGLGAAMMAALTAISVLLSLIPPVAAMLGNLAAFAAAMIGAVRFVPFLVGQAIGQPLTLAQSWAVSRGNAMAIAMSLVLAQLPFVIGLTLLQQILAVTGFSTLAPAGTLFIVSVVQVADWICQAGIMATAYRHLVGVRV